MQDAQEERHEKEGQDKKDRPKGSERPVIAILTPHIHTTEEQVHVMTAMLQDEGHTKGLGKV